MNRMNAVFEVEINTFYSLLNMLAHLPRAPFINDCTLFYELTSPR